MNNRATLKEVAVGEKRYQLKKIDARSACWLFAFLGSKATGGSIISGLGACTKPEFDEITSLVLKPILCLDRTQDGNFELPILSVAGIIADDNLMDAGNMMMLVSEAIVFNLEPFLAERGLNSAP
jgi:hypothetical protein